jgi:WhiB family transcriptional regulator, redox-sensing transcriptional regulator
MGLEQLAKRCVLSRHRFRTASELIRPREVVDSMAEISRLPGPVADIWEWQLQGSCRDADPRLFFHPEGERGPARRERDAAARQVCGACPVLEQCRSHALAVREPYGVWGGLTEDDREAIYAGERHRHLRAAS